MNRTLKIAMAAAIATLGLAGQAHALTNSTTSTSGDLFLYVFDDRAIDSSGTNSAIFDLGSASSFATGSSQTITLNSTAWTTYVASIANTAGVKWGVFGSAIGTGGTGTTMLTTETGNTATGFSVNGSALNTAVTHYNALETLYGGASCTSCGFTAVTSKDAADTTSWANNAGILTGTVTAGLGSNMDFYQYVSTGTQASKTATATAFATAGAQDYFTLSNTGVLTYTAAAPVPEADSYALMLAGLGLVGLLARRRKV